MNLGETVTYRGLEGVFHGEACLYRLHVPSAFGGRAGFDLNISHVLPQGVLAALTLRSEERRVGKECRSRWSPYH